jgi:hypothetical protein
MSREMRWAVGTFVVVLALLAAGAAAGAGRLFDPPDPTETPTQLPTSTSTPAPAGVTLSLTATDGTPLPGSPSPTATLTPTSTLTATATRTVTPTVTQTPSVRRITSAELALVLRGHIESQRAQFQDGKVRFVAPDKVIITGSTGIAGRATPIEADLTVGVDANGRPRILAYRLVLASGQPAPPEAQAALAARVTQSNTEVDALVPRGQRVRRVWVTNNPDTLWAEVAE